MRTDPAARPLAELLGFKEQGRYQITLEDAGRYAGHLCPTVATAFELAREGLSRLYRDELPVRGDVSVKVHSAPDVFANGPVGRIVGYITGAAGADGFRGLAGRFARAGLLRYEPEAQPLVRSRCGGRIRARACACVPRAACCRSSRRSPRT